MPHNSSPSQLTIEWLRQRCTYHPDLGVFTCNKTGRVMGCQNGAYRMIHFGKYGKIYVHRLAYFWMTGGEWPPDQIDHKLHDGSDNRWAMIRPATRSQNMWNRTVPPGHAAGCNGVYQQHGRWYADIRDKGTRRRREWFPTMEEAIAARRAWEAEQRIWS